MDDDKNLTDIINACRGRTNRMPFCEAGFTESGKMRLASVFGWITGLANAGKKDVAIKAANDFVFAIQRFIVPREKIEIAKNLVYVPLKLFKIYDDFAFNSFAFTAYRLNLEEEKDNDNENLIQDSAYTLDTGKRTTLNYSFDYNGGLIYHGPGAGENWSVTLDNSRWWSTHT